MNVYQVLPIHLMDMKIFRRITDNCDLLLALGKKSGDHQVSKIHIFRTLNVKDGFENPSIIYQDFHQKLKLKDTRSARQAAV